MAFGNVVVWNCYFWGIQVRGLVAMSWQDVPKKYKMADNNAYLSIETENHTQHLKNVSHLLEYVVTNKTFNSQKYFFSGCVFVMSMLMELRVGY